ncbi:MAG TPA: TIM barrel protein [Naasia sp.]
MTPILTLQSDMCGTSLDDVLSFNAGLGISAIDAKTGLAGEPVEALTVEAAREFRRKLVDHGAYLFAFSTSLLHVDVAAVDALRGEAERVRALLPVLEALTPRYVRVLAPTMGNRAGASASSEGFPVGPVSDVIVEIARVCAEAGAELLIENGPEASIVSSPADAVSLFSGLAAREPRVHAIWDVQNMWQCGWFPTAADLPAMAPFTRYVHVKGGRTDDGAAPGPLMWASALEDASWPVDDLLNAVTATATVEAVALNPSHGRMPEGVTAAALRDRDIAYLLPRLQTERLSGVA